MRRFVRRALCPRTILDSASGRQSPSDLHFSSDLPFRSKPMAAFDTYRVLAVRDGRTVPVTCNACGCRLNGVDGEWFHFGALAGRDARGCRDSVDEQPPAVSGRSQSLEQLALL